MFEIYRDIHQANLDREFETILINLLHYNMSPVVEVPIRHFLQEYVIIRDDFWNQFGKCNSFDMAFDYYYQYAKNKRALIDSLLNNLNFALGYDPLQNDLSLIMKDGLTF
ncbi:MAG: hypothetical protein RI100_04815 [Nitrosarchaeum sp.]|jgi:hypothetical protein|uniref:hypothetical protein n=1 Tax=Nitrosarchaeum sp. TaxID=2026886 RepID=UPI002DED9D20|nr:hypothetical protein [Nitrosarchaeum sp.]